MHLLSGADHAVLGAPNRGRGRRRANARDGIPRGPSTTGAEQAVSRACRAGGVRFLRDPIGPVSATLAHTTLEHSVRARTPGTTDPGARSPTPTSFPRSCGRVFPQSRCPHRDHHRLRPRHHHALGVPDGAGAAPSMTNRPRPCARPSRQGRQEPWPVLVSRALRLFAGSAARAHHDDLTAGLRTAGPPPSRAAPGRHRRPPPRHFPPPPSDVTERRGCLVSDRRRQTPKAGR
jgi:hypothetical protein